MFPLQEPEGPPLYVVLPPGSIRHWSAGRTPYVCIFPWIRGRPAAMAGERPDEGSQERCGCRNSSTSRPVVGRPTVDTSDRRPWAFGEEDTLCIDAWFRCDASIHAQKVLGTVIYTGLAAAACSP